MRTHDNEPFVLRRDVKAVMVPAGIEIELKSGQSGFITQALGGSFTLYMEGNLFRLAGADADAIGKEVVKTPELPPNSTEDDVLALAWEQLRTCYDPEIPINIVDLGLIYECTVSAQPDGGRVINVRLTLTAPGCGMGDVLVQDIKAEAGNHPHRRRGRRRAGVRSAVESIDDDRGRPPADGNVLISHVRAGLTSAASPNSNPVHVSKLTSMATECAWRRSMARCTRSKTAALTTTHPLTMPPSKTPRSSARVMARASACAPARRFPRLPTNPCGYSKRARTPAASRCAFER